MADESDQGLERLTFFSDAVIAIALTLLALDLPLPTGESNAQLWHSFVHLLPRQYLTFVISFAVIAAYWSAHHRFFQHVVRSSRRLVSANLLYLFTIVILPFATRLLGEDGRFPIGAAFYAAVIALAGLSLLVILWAVRHDGLLGPDEPADRGAELTRSSLVVTGAFAVSIPIAFWDTSVAKYAWLVLPLLGNAAIRLVRHRMAGRRPATASGG